jgi:hypothetical protein
MTVRVMGPVGAQDAKRKEERRKRVESGKWKVEFFFMGIPFDFSNQ